MNLELLCVTMDSYTELHKDHSELRRDAVPIYVLHFLNTTLPPPVPDDLTEQCRQ